ncbi:serine/Arginine-related protein 53 [Passer domesticus]|uniref:serine/Arginine-related protein 53 n=1 Tax=Passer domesticus TaxID=48849 RepID=UPI0030FE301B
MAARSGALVQRGGFGSARPGGSRLGPCPPAGTAAVPTPRVERVPRPRGGSRCRNPRLSLNRPGRNESRPAPLSPRSRHRGRDSPCARGSPRLSPCRARCGQSSVRSAPSVGSGTRPRDHPRSPPARHPRRVAPGGRRVGQGADSARWALHPGGQRDPGGTPARPNPGPAQPRPGPAPARPGPARPGSARPAWALPARRIDGSALAAAAWPRSAVDWRCLPAAPEGAGLEPGPRPLRQALPGGSGAAAPVTEVSEMGRRSSDTEEEGRSRRKKKHRRRSSSSSSSDSRAYSRKKSGRKSRSRSRSRDLPSWSHSYEKRRRHRSSSSSSYGSRRKRSRSRGRGKSYRSQRSRSKSRTRRSRQRSYSRSSERSGHRRTPSGSRERRRARDKAKDKDKGKGKDKESHGTKAGDSANIKAGLEHLTPAEQAKARLQLVLEAAAKADEALKAKERSEEEAKRKKEEDQATLLDQVKRVKEIEAIESDAFVPQTFRSSKDVKKSAEPAEPQQEPVNVGAGAPEAAAAEKEPPAASIPTAIKYQDDNSLAHPNLFMEKAEAEQRWFQRLVALRQERLMGSPVA